MSSGFTLYAILQVFVCIGYHAGWHPDTYTHAHRQTTFDQLIWIDKLNLFTLFANSELDVFSAMRSLERIVALLPWCSSVCLSGTCVHCDHTVHVGADLDLSWLYSSKFWTLWHRSMSTHGRHFPSSTWNRGGVWICVCHSHFKMPATASQIYFRFPLWWRIAIKKVKMYLHTKFRQHSSIRDRDITISGF